MIWIFFTFWVFAFVGVNTSVNLIAHSFSRKKSLDTRPTVGCGGLNSGSLTESACVGKTNPVLRMNFQDSLGMRQEVKVSSSVLIENLVNNCRQRVLIPLLPFG